MLLAEGVALNLGPNLEAVGCKLFSILGLCKSKEARHIEKLNEENQRNKCNVDWLNTQTGSAVKILSAEELTTGTRVETIRNNTNRNLDLLATQINEMGKKMETYEWLGIQNNSSVSRLAEIQLSDEESAKNYIRTTRASSLCTCHCYPPGICAKRSPNFSNKKTITSHFAVATTN